MKKKFIVLLLIFVTANLYAQNRQVDSLKLLLAKEKTDTGKVNLLNELGSGFGFGRSRNDSSLWYSQQALELSQKAGYTKGELEARLNMTNYLFQTGNYPKALELSLYNLKMANQFHDMQTLFLQNRVTGWIYARLGDKNKELEYAKKLGPLAPLIPVKDPIEKETFIWIANNVMTMAYADLKNQDSTLYYLQLIYKGAVKTKKPGLLALATAGLGDYYSQNGNDSLAFFYFRECIPNAIRAKRVDGVVHAETAIAKVFQRKGQLDSALFYGRQALNKVQTIDAPDDLRDVYSLLSDLYVKRHQYDSAYKYEHGFVVLKDSLFNQTKITQAQNFSFNETLQRQQIEQTKKDAQQEYAAKIKLYILVAVILIFLLIAFFLMRNLRNKREANKLLHKKNEEIQTALSELKSTQSQLIQSEKMASLGELTAGIAHEIQNPLNFVNNFSEVNKEMLEELKAERAKPKADRDDELQNELVNDVIANEEKILHHGKRADAIVKGMLQHSRTSSGQKEPTDINALCDEYLRLSYHGLRAKDKDFNCEIKTDFDETIGKINIVSQDIGRVLLNLFNNAFYAVNERLRQAQPGKHYKPTVMVKTFKTPSPLERGRGEVVITVKDNGSGIPQNIIDKIFQPFFTTKPTGSGTGLGLSLSYDIVKAHSGEIKVETLSAEPAAQAGKEGEGTIFIIRLPG